MDELIEGYRRFRATRWDQQRSLFRKLAARGQRPHTMVIACSDSRVDPAILFDAAPGEIFTVRNVANLVPPYGPDSRYHGTSAALEFAVTVLEVDNVVVLGHAQCGGVHALLHEETRPAGDFVGLWMQLAAPARDRAVAAGGDEATVQRRCEEETVKESLMNLRSFPWIADRVAERRLTLYGAFFGIEEGQLFRLDSDGEFRPVAS
ncbi:MAG: Carbonate dehydratase [Rhodospirillales bacterium]|nr:Carbonate dehydratase [Rhodospirillales bacterium]